MPVVNFSQVSRLFAERGSDRTSTDGSNLAAESAGAEAQNIAPQPTGLDKFVSNQGRNFRAGAANEAFNQATRLPLVGDRILNERMRRPYAGGLRTERTGFVLTSDLWRQGTPGNPGGKALALHAGPQSVNWSLALRAQDEETKVGHARYAQARTFGVHAGEGDQTWFDFPRVSFTFQAGNLIPIEGFQRLEADIPYGLQDFYNFFDLLNQPPILPAGGLDPSKEGAHNYTWVFYTSLQLPQVVLKGYFDPEGVTWNDDAESPTMLNWEASFIVHEMSPNLWDTDELAGTYRSYMRDSITFF